MSMKLKPTCDTVEGPYGYDFSAMYMTYFSCFLGYKG